MNCTEQYGNPPRQCTHPAKWWFKNPTNQDRLEGPYCGYHARQFLPKALVPVFDLKVMILQGESEER